MTMSPPLRNLALSAHIASSVGLLGAIAAFLALAVAGLAGEDLRIVRSAYPAMEMIARFVIVPLALAALASGTVQALGTPWGLLRHWWVVAKLLVTVAASGVLISKLALIAHASTLAAQPVLALAELRAVGAELAVHAAAGLLVLLAPLALSVYKPRGLTPYGRRQRGDQEGSARRPARPAASGGGAVKLRPAGTVIFRLRRTQLIGAALALVLLHAFVLLHVMGGTQVAH